MTIEKYLSYKSQRDTVFVLGAGASSADGVPLQRDLLPFILQSGIPEINDSQIGRIVTEFIADNFAFNPLTGQYPALEAVFGFLDYFIQQNESLNSKYTNDRIRDIKEYLIKLIHYVVNMQMDKGSPYYHLFWNAVSRYNPNTSIITLNYDTLLEQAFEFLFKKFGYIDYCLPLMNYEKQSNLNLYNFWINPRVPVKVEEDENPVPIKIIKLHGSLNWKYCNCCNQTLLTPWDRKIDLNEGKFLGYTYPDKKEYEFLCPQDGTRFQTLIMPPSYIKSLQHPVISQLISEAAREIRATRKLVFVGYSLSDADVHIKALFKKNISADTEMIVINSKQKESLELIYKSITKNVKFIYMSFEELVRDEPLLKSILL